MESKVIKKGVRNAIYVIISQSISLVLGIARTLILPLLLGVTNFGYWQVYLLYLSYVGIFTFGFNDGIYLKYGKYEYEELPRETFRSSIRLFFIFQMLITLTVSIVVFFEPDYLKQTSMLWALISIPIAGLTGVLTYVLQITNQLKKYSFYVVLDKVIVLIIIAVAFLLKLDNFLFIIIVDTLSRVLVLGLMISSCRDIIFGRGSNYQLAFQEIIDDVRIGIKLMLANFAGMLVLGFGRFLVERTASIEEYGVYSFSISTMNLVLVLVTAIGLVIYPTLNRLDQSKYANYFSKLNSFLVFIVFGLLFFLFPLKVFILRYMLDYISLFDYLSIIFAIVFVQAKMQVLINPYYKILRKESEMLRANLLGLLVATIVITPLYMLTESITMVATGTLLAMLIRLYLSEIYLKKEQKILDSQNIIFELLSLLLFIILGLLNNIYLGAVLYLLFYSIFMIKQFKEVKGLKKYILGR